MIETDSKGWVENWKRVGPILAKLRVEEYRRSSVADIIFRLSDASDAALRSYPSKPTSGLIEMQRLFARQRRP